MILSRWPGDGECFRELDDAVRLYDLWERHSQRTVVFNANHIPAPAGAIVYNTDFVGIHCDPEAWRGHEIWDFCQRNIARYPSDLPVTHVPIGYHPSMTRFQRSNVRDIDVIFVGSLNVRRENVLAGFRRAGVNVVHVPDMFGVKRDRLLARSKLALNMIFYADAVYPTVRAAHLVANEVPMLSETAPEMPAWCGEGVSVDLLVEAGLELLKHPEYCEEKARELKVKFQSCPMVLP